MIIEGFVERGKHLGHSLGFPTLNVRPERVTGDWPENGVYAAAVWIGNGERAWPGMLNQGVHPTLPEGKPTVEVHVMGLDADLYGAAVTVEYLRFMRRERRFEDVEALKAQLTRDREAVLAWLRDAAEAPSPDALQRRAAQIAWMPADA